VGTSPPPDTRALGVSVEWLVHGTGGRERLSDVCPVVAPKARVRQHRGRATFRSPIATSRLEAIALLSTTVEPEVIIALRAVVPDDPSEDPGRDYWIDYARELAKDLRRIKGDPVLTGAARTKSGGK
jgi:hypothetical protein